MLEIINECPVCKGKQFKKVISAKDHLITKASFEIVSCLDCNFLFTNPRPFSEDLAKYYKSEEYDSHKRGSSGLKDVLYNVVRNYSTKKKLQYIKSISKGNKLLDVGSGAGFFINYCYQQGWQVEGLEPNLNNFPNLPKDVKIHSSLSTIGKNAFDIITLWHSLEHIPELDEVIKTIKSALKRDGKIIIAVPNINSFDSKEYDKYWAALDVPRHLYHFTPQSMEKLLNNFGLKVSNIQPMVFDSFYVSLLSEKIKTGRMNYFNAFKNGMRSNSWARRNGNNYSSLMYTIEKAS